MLSLASPQSLNSAAFRFWPGVLLAFTIAAAASFISLQYAVPVMLVALLMGMAFNFLLAGESACAPGIDLSARFVLRLGIALLGIRVSVSDFLAFGWSSIATVVALVALTIGAGMLAARVLGQSWRFGLLSGGAVAICGASAALAISAVISRGDAENSDTLMTVIVVTMLSTIAMVAYPPLFGLLGLADAQIGYLLGASIHDVAQVVGAGFSVSQEAGDAATITKLMRITLLPVVLMLIIAFTGRRSGEDKVPGLPWFLVVFLALACLNSLVALPEWLSGGLQATSQILLVTAIGALGVKTSLKTMLRLGGQKVMPAIFATLCLLGFAVLAMLFVLR